MKIFVASSRESLKLVREIGVWLEEQGHEPLPWDKPGLFMPGEQTFNILMELSREVEAAVFVFGADDEVWYRGDTVPQPRDNVLIEYGLFAGALGLQKAIVCRDGKSKKPVDLAGLTYIDVSQARRERARLELSLWARRLSRSTTDPAIHRLQGKIAALENEKDGLAERLGFESEKSRDLKQILQQTKVLDFSRYDLKCDGHWKLLFEYDYFRRIAQLVNRAVASPVELRQLFIDAGAEDATKEIAWHSTGDRKQLERSKTRTIFIARKLLRRLRDHEGVTMYQQFVSQTPLALRSAIDAAGEDCVERLAAEQKDS